MRYILSYPKHDYFQHVIKRLIMGYFTFFNLVYILAGHLSSRLTNVSSVWQSHDQKSLSWAVLFEDSSGQACFTDIWSIILPLNHALLRFLLHAKLISLKLLFLLQGAAYFYLDITPSEVSFIYLLYGNLSSEIISLFGYCLYPLFLCKLLEGRDCLMFKRSKDYFKKGILKSAYHVILQKCCYLISHLCHFFPVPLG